jgi:hypothetical protein
MNTLQDSGVEQAFRPAYQLQKMLGFSPCDKSIFSTNGFRAYSPMFILKFFCCSAEFTSAVKSRF